MHPRINKWKPDRNHESEWRTHILFNVIRRTHENIWKQQDGHYEMGLGTTNCFVSCRVVKDSQSCSGTVCFDSVQAIRKSRRVRPSVIVAPTAIMPRFFRLPSACACGDRRWKCQNKWRFDDGIAGKPRSSASLEFSWSVRVACFAIYFQFIINN